MLGKVVGLCWEQYSDFVKSWGGRIVNILIPLGNLQDRAKAHPLMKPLKNTANQRHKRCPGILPFA